MPPDHDAFVGAVGELKAVTATLSVEVKTLREFKDRVLAICPVHEKRIEGIERRVGGVESELRDGNEWMHEADMQRAQFSGGWKLIVLLGTALSGAVAIFAAIKGML